MPFIPAFTSDVRMIGAGPAFGRGGTTAGSTGASPYGLWAGGFCADSSPSRDTAHQIAARIDFIRIGSLPNRL